MTDEACKAKKELLQYRQAKRDIEDMKEKIEIKGAEVNAVCKPLRDIMIQRSSENSRERLLDLLIELQEKYYNMQTAAEDLCMEIENKISYLENGIYQRILRNCYLYNQRLEKIAVDEKYSFSQIKRIHVRALEKYYKIIKGELKR
jgi:hypothetical protein